MYFLEMNALLVTFNPSLLHFGRMHQLSCFRLFASARADTATKPHNRRAFLLASTKYGSRTSNGRHEAARARPPAATGCTRGCALRSPRRGAPHTAPPLLSGGAATGGFWWTRAASPDCWCSSRPMQKGPGNRAGTGGSGRRSLCCTGAGRGTWTATKAGTLTW